jgi:integrase
MAIKTRKVIALKPTKRKDGSLSYKARYYHPDYTHCEKALKKGNKYCSGHTAGTVSDSEAEALAKGWALQAELAGSGKPIISTDPDTVTMDETCGMWIRSAPSGIGSRTLRGYAERWRAMKNRDQVIGMTPVASVTKVRVVGWLSASRDLGHSDSTMKQDLILLRHIARYAVLLDLIAEDFTKDIKAPSSLQGKPSKRTRLTPDQVRAVASHIGGILGDAIMLDLYTGLRLSELLGLKASKLTRGGDYVLAITEQWDERAKTYRLPKRDKTRYVPILLTEIQKLLNKHLLQYPASHTKHGIMFATSNGTHFLQSNFRKVWNRALHDLGLPHCSPHSIRATMVDYWIDAGMTFEQLAPIVGHKNSDITRNTYYRDPTVDDSISAMKSVITRTDTGTQFASVREA